MRVLVGASSFASEEALSLLNDNCIELTLNPYGRRMTQQEIIATLPGFDGLLAGLEPLNAQVLEHAPELRAIARIGIGVDNIDFNAASRLGIKVSNTPDGPTEAVAEMTTAALLTIAHRIIPSNRDIHNGIWEKRRGFSLQGLRVLVVGYGRIGQTTANLLEKFGCLITVYDPYIKEYSGVALEDAVKNVDVITLHASGSEEIITPEILKGLQKGTVLLNSARGGLVNENALHTALQDGTVGWFWADALWKEPYDGPLKECENAILTPHISTYTATCRNKMEYAAAQNIIRDLV